MSRLQVAAPPKPFKGLAPFEDSALDARFFFGREREIELIVANLMANRLTLLYGPSGVGKTSLLGAGLAQRLREDPEALVVVVSSWAGDPVGELLDATEEAALGLAGAPVEPVRRTGSLADVLGTWVRRLGRNVYLVLDQFEEYFLYHQGESGPGTLLDELPEALRRQGLRANFLLGMREDSLAGLDVFKGRIPNLFGNTLRLDRLDRRAGEAAIVGPIGEYNRLHPQEGQMEIEPELVDALLSEVAAGRVDLGFSGRGGVEDEAGEGRIEAPYLQLVLERLWDVETSRGSSSLRLDTLRELGGAARVVEDHLERAMSELSASEKDAAAAIYNHLVTPSGTKIAHRAGDLAGYAAVSETDAARVLGRLVQERIVRAGEDGAAGPRYEIFHDVLADAVLAWRARHEADRRIEAERAAAARRHRRTLIFAIVAAVAVAVLAAISVYALGQRSNARSEARHARARELGALASLQLTVDPERSLRLALQANALESSPQTEDVLRTALRRLRVQAILRGGGAVAAVAFSPDGTLVVTAAGGGEARLFRSDTGGMVGQLVHGAPVTAAAFSPDGSLVVTGGRDGVARIWPIRGASLHELDHDGPVTSVTFSADGRELATTSEDGTARIWDVAGGRLLHTLRHPHAVKSASFSRDGRLLVTALVDAVRDRVARVFDVRSGRLVQRLVQPEQERVTVARFAPSGELVVTGSGKDSARVWDARTGKLRLRLEGHKSAVLDAEFSPGGDRIVTASSDQTARVWDAKTGDLITPLSRHMNHVVRAHFSPDGRSVVTASDDRLATVFDAFSGTVLAELVGHEDTVVDAVFSPDGATVASASPDGTARLWDALPQPPLTPLGSHRGKIVSLKFSPDGALVASAGEDGRVRLWRYAGGLVRTFVGDGEATDVLFSRDGSLVLGTNADGTARVWRTASGALVRTFRHPGAVIAADLSPGARLVATADNGNGVRLWELATGRLVRKLEAKGPVRALAFSPDGRLLVTGGAGDTVARLWRLADGARLHELQGHDGGIVTASFSPDGRRLVTASYDTTARIWSTTTGALEHELRGHRLPLTSASFSPDGRLVVTTSLDGESRVWLAASGRQSVAPMRQAGAVNGAAFSGDGRWLVTAGPSAGVWEVRTGRALFLLRPRESFAAVSAAAFSPSGLRIAVAVAPVPAHPDGTVRTYDCRICAGVDQLVALAQARLARLRR